MMPMGFEYGCRKPLHVIDTRPADWAWETETPRIDITGFIRDVNAMKAATPALNVEGAAAEDHGTAQPGGRLQRLANGDLASSADIAITLINPDPGRVQGIDPGPLLNQVSGRISHFEDVTPDDADVPFEPGEPITPPAPVVRVFRGYAEAEIKPPESDKATAQTR